MNTPNKSFEKYVFFLGGYDLEMITIREILEENNLPFYDKKLNWGAKLSDYKKEFEQLENDKIPVLIELQLDYPTPKNTEIIEHHNEIGNFQEPILNKSIAQKLPFLIY